MLHKALQNKWVRVLIAVFATFLYALGVNLFIVPMGLYSGGVVGLMDLGRVSGCQGYGPVSSSDGDYVGGIAGASYGFIRDSWARCQLSGKDYVGGVAGYGSTIENSRSRPPRVS